MAEWLQVNTSTGEIYSSLRTPADASSLPTEPGGSWIQVDPSEYQLAADGERVSWNDAAAVGSRVEENPYPRLRFTGGNVSGRPYEFALEVGEASPPQLTIQVVDRDGNPLTPTATRRIFIGGTVQKYKPISVVSGSVTLDIPVGANRIITIGNQERVLTDGDAWVDGFLVEDPLLIVVADAVADTDL